MLKVSKRTEYGLRAMTCLAKQGKGQVLSIKEISRKEGISFDFLEKIISQLERAGLLKSKKGIRGGYYLAKKLKSITVAEIVEVLEGKISPVGCSACQKSKKCLSKDVWDKVKESLFKTLDSITLSDLVK
jgi:Rrf2 family protein